MLLEFDGKKPRVGRNVFIAPTATVVGDVSIADNASIWYGAVLRGDLAAISVGPGTNIQDNCTLHTDRGKPVVIGARVTVGHNAVVHSCTLEDRCLIGINATILSGACVKSGTVVAAGAVVREGQTVGPNQLVAGMPAMVKRKLSPEAVDELERRAQGYKQLAAKHAASLRPPDNTESPELNKPESKGRQLST